MLTFHGAASMSGASDSGLSVEAASSSYRSETGRPVRAAASETANGHQELMEAKRTMDKILIAFFTFSATLAGPFGASALAETLEDCQEPTAGSKEAPIFSPPVADVVTGAGRLQFYSAPNFRCPMEGVFVIPKDVLFEYARTDDGWSSVMYENSRGGNPVSGWVRSARLRITGTLGPKQ